MDAHCTFSAHKNLIIMMTKCIAETETQTHTDASDTVALKRILFNEINRA